MRDPVDRLEIAIGTAFTVTIGSAVALVITYSRGGQTQLEGIFLGAALAGFAIGIGLWARHAMPGGGDVEEIEPLPSPADDRDAAAAEFERGGGSVSSPGEPPSPGCSGPAPRRSVSRSSSPSDRSDPGPATPSPRLRGGGGGDS